jgi:hypothetical protein
VQSAESSGDHVGKPSDGVTVQPESTEADNASPPDRQSQPDLGVTSDPDSLPSAMQARAESVEEDVGDAPQPQIGGAAAAPDASPAAESADADANTEVADEPAPGGAEATDESEPGGADATTRDQGPLVLEPMDCVANAPSQSCTSEGQVCTLEDDRVCLCSSVLQGTAWQCEVSCPEEQPAGDCTGQTMGTICNYGDQTCRCLSRPTDVDNEFTRQWECAEEPTSYCPAEVPEPGSSCVPNNPTPGFSVEPCVYPTHSSAGLNCWCSGQEDSATWFCRDRACPAGQINGSCDYPLGLACAYTSGATDSADGLQRCECAQSDSGDTLWFCNGKPTPACPEGPAANLADTACDGYAEMSYCFYGQDSCFCRDTWRCQIAQPPGDPVSRRRYKRDISYLSPADRDLIAAQLLSMKIARYEYIDDADGRGPQLGFIIEDSPQIPAVAADGRHVNLYAYASMLVAANQQQAERIASLETKLEQLREQVEALP